MNKRHLRRLTGFLVLSLFFTGIYFLINTLSSGNSANGNFSRNTAENNLAITRYAVEKKIYRGEKFGIYAEVKNTGNRDIKGPFDIIWVPDTTQSYKYYLKTRIEVDTLKAGAEKLIEFSGIGTELPIEGKVTSAIRVLSTSQEQNNDDNYKTQEIEFISDGTSGVQFYTLKKKGWIEVTYTIAGNSSKESYYNKNNKTIRLPAGAANIKERSVRSAGSRPDISRPKVVESKLKDNREKNLVNTKEDNTPRNASPSSSRTTENTNNEVVKNTKEPAKENTFNNTDEKKAETNEEETEKAIIPPTAPVITNEEIAAGLKEALKLGVERQVSKLARTDGFYKNKKVKIPLPKEVQEKKAGLSLMGVGNLANEIEKLLNRAAEEAVGKAIPLIEKAVNDVTFPDPKSVLSGKDNAAVKQLERATKYKLNKELRPIVESALTNVGAMAAWKKIQDNYKKAAWNVKPMLPKGDTDLTAHVTDKTLNSIYTMIAAEEAAIRNNENARITDLLYKIFVEQD